MDWVELIYALRYSGFINGGNITLKRLFRILGDVFDIEAKEFSRTFTDIKNRNRKERTKLLDLLKSGLLQRMDEADMKPSKKYSGIQHG